MRKKLWKKITAFMLASVMVMGVTACGRESKEEASSKKISEESEYVYEVSFQNVDTSLESVSNICVHDGRVYMLGYQYEENRKKDTSVCRNFLMNCETDGSDMKQQELDLNEEEIVYYLDINEEDQIHLLTKMNIYDEKAQENEVKYYLHTVDMDGKTEDSCEMKVKKSEEEDFYIGNAVITEDAVFISSYTGVYSFNMRGKRRTIYDFGDHIDGMVQTENGEIYVCGYNGTDYGLRKLDVEKGEFGDFISLLSRNIYRTENGYYNIIIHAGKGNELYINDSNNVHCFDMETGKFTTLFNWVNSDIDGNNIREYFPVKDGEFLAVNNSDQKSEIELASLKKVKASDRKEKKVLKLSCIYVNNSIKKSVLSFNKTSADYRVEIKDYSGYEDPATQLNLDMISGDIPDILSIDSLPVSQYVKKGILADLYPLMEKDEEISKEDFIDSVINTIEEDGKLYYMGPSFDVQPLLGSKKLMGDMESWTVDDMLELYDSMPEDGVFLCDDTCSMTRQLFIQNILSNQMENFVNMDAGEVDFDSEDFIKILEFSKNFPDKQEPAPNGGDEISMPVLVQRGKLMLNNSFSLYCIPDIQLYTKMYEKTGGFTVLNYPSTEEDNRLSMSIDNATLAITEKCGDKESAWEFVRLFLTYDYQKNNGFYNGIPTRKDALEKLLEYAVATEAYTDEDGTTVEPIDIHYIYDGYDVFVGPLKEEEVSMIHSIIDRVGKCTSNDNIKEGIDSIIAEEAESFFAGDRTAEEAAQLIQNRARIYVSENS